MTWVGVIITVAVLVVGYFAGVLRPTGLLSRTQPAKPRPNGLRSAAKVILILFGLGMLSTFGYNGIWARLQIGIEGTILSRQDRPQSPDAHGPTTLYRLQRSDGTSLDYVATDADASLPRTLAVGARIVKRQGELAYALDGRRVDDFPLAAYLAFLFAGLVSLIAGAALLAAAA